MKITEFNLGPLGANCYLLSENGKDAVLVDAGGADDDLISYLEENEISLKAILLTHGHYDHIMGVSKLREITGAKVYIHDYDAELTTSSEKNRAAYHFPKEYYVPFSADCLFNDGDVINEAGMKFAVMHCPGHTRGSSCFIIDNKIFCGDAVFKGSIGRSDMYGSDPVVQRVALMQFYELKSDYEMYCGHGENTTLKYELKTNPFLLRR